MADAPFPAGLVPAWERLLADPARLVLDPDSGVCEAAFDDALIFPLQRKRELAKMLAIARRARPKTVMEIGADKGGGLLHWCLLPTVELVVACEIRGCPYWDLLPRAFPHIHFAWMERPSLPAAAPPKPIDVLFIDGDKLGFVEDFDAYLPLMAPDGVVFMHDVRDREPAKAFGVIQGRGYRTEVIFDVSEYAEEWEREQQGLPPANPHAGWLRHWRGQSCGVGVIYLGEKP